MNRSICATHILRQQKKAQKLSLKKFVSHPHNFREDLLKKCGALYKNWDARDILALMQHFGAPTRLLDFTYDPRVAAYFALKNSRGDSAIWMIDKNRLDQRRHEMKLPDYCGPNHDPKYCVFEKGDNNVYLSIASILNTKQHNERLAAQQGCFLVPGSISRYVDDDLVFAKVRLSKTLVLEAFKNLKMLGFNHKCLFPNLKIMANEAKRVAVIKNVEFFMKNLE